jgi:triacylglycerol lipase
MPNSSDIALNRVGGKVSSLVRCASLGNEGDYVILIHGLFLSPFFMKKIASALEGRGYNVINFNYPSRKYPIDTLANKFLAEFVRTYCVSKKKKIHFVTHSLGGILVRKYLAEHPIVKMGKVVMFAPPNHGSEIADFLKNNFLYKFIYGPAGQQLGANKRSYVNSLPNKVTFDLGVIAGSKSHNPLSSFLIKRKNDGTVSVSSTKITGMKDHITIPSSHVCILYNKEAIDQLLFFLDNGHFDK